MGSPNAREGGESASGWFERGANLGKTAVATAVALATLAVLLDLFGLVDVFGEDETGGGQASRLPGEYLYLDDQRVDAYLGQLRGGLAPVATRSSSLTRQLDAKLSAADLVQVGGSLQKQQTLQETVTLRAADRFYDLETLLEARFMRGKHGLAQRFRRIRANADGCSQIGNARLVEEGQIVRITGAHLQAPTYVLALAKVAHAAQFVTGPQVGAGFRVKRGPLSRLSSTAPTALKSYVKGFGSDPKLPFRVRIRAAGKRRDCDIFLPARYSKLTNSPSLLTGGVTIVGKVVRRLTPTDAHYFDVETAATYEPAVRAAAPKLRETLGLADRRLLSLVIDESAATDYPGLVVLPLAIYK